MSKTKI